MTDNITPSEGELKAARELRVWFSDGGQKAAAIIARHTRHEGRTAQEWANEATGQMQMRKDWQQRAARVKELEVALSAALDGAQEYNGLAVAATHNCDVMRRRVEELEAERDALRQRLNLTAEDVAHEASYRQLEAERDGLALLVLNLSDDGAIDHVSESVRESIEQAKAMREVVGAAKCLPHHYCRCEICTRFETAIAKLREMETR